MDHPQAASVDVLKKSGHHASSFSTPVVIKNIMEEGRSQNQRKKIPLII
jgi:hypothetical protein